MVNFYDTNAILELCSNLGEYGKFYISSVTLYEIEHIKVSRNKDDNTKWKARTAIRWLSEHTDMYEVVTYTEEISNILNIFKLEDTPDNKICACAKYLSAHEDICFVSADICCRVIAKQVFNLTVSDIYTDTSEIYTGFKEIIMSSDDEMAYFYENLKQNIYSLLLNQYIIIKNPNGEIVDTYRWNGEEHVPLYKKGVKSIYFDKLKPKDVYQSCVIDSLMNCTITAISGKAGSGKSLLALMVAMNLIETGKYDRLVVMFNPTKTRGSSDLGYYSGDFIDKAMQNSIGQILTTKFGDRYAIDLLMQQNKLKLISMADARGSEISDSEILWITEAQNTSIDLIKLCLSRVSSGAKVFIEGDYTAQVDSNAFEGNNNGLKRVIDVFKGHEEFGYIQLQNVWRSKIAELCELL